MAFGDRARLVSSRIKGRLLSTAEARSIHTRFPSHVPRAAACARSSGQPHTEAATRRVVVLPKLVWPHQSTKKFGAPMIARITGVRLVYSASRTRGYPAT